GRNQSGKAITLRLLSLAEHEEYIVAARDFCIEAYKNPTDPALALMAARFTSTSPSLRSFRSRSARANPSIVPATARSR
ncbi:hypothetical protein GQF55_24000, partial [Escherichia coli]|nr:hypothetical protein [Escherichia coli]